MFNKHKSKIVTIAVYFLTFIFMDPSLSGGFTDFILKKQISSDYNKQVECLAKNIYYESGNESYLSLIHISEPTRPY